MSEANFTIKGRRLRHTRKPRLAITPENAATVEVIESEFKPSEDTNLKSAKTDANAQIVSKNYLIKTKRKVQRQQLKIYFYSIKIQNYIQFVLQFKNPLTRSSNLSKIHTVTEEIKISLIHPY